MFEPSLPKTWGMSVLLLPFLVGCPDLPEPAGSAGGGVAAATSSSPTPAASASPSPFPARATEGEGAYSKPGADDYTPGAPYPIPDPLPAKSRPQPVAESPAPQDGAGAVELVLGGKGESPGRFGYPRAMATTKEGLLFVADKTGRIQRFTPEGKVERLVYTPGLVQGKPTGLGIDEHGDLLVADTHYCRVLVYDTDLKLKRAYGAPGPDPGQFMMITSVHAAGGLHYTTDFGDQVARVQVWREDGTYLRTWGSFGWDPDQFRRPMNLAIDPQRDRVYVADAANHRVSIFSSAGELQGHLGGEGKEQGKLGYPYDVKLDELGRIWVAEFGNQRVSVFTPEGACLGIWGGPGRAVGGVNRPWAVALGTKQRVWVLDSNGDRCYGMHRKTWLGS